MKKVGLVATTVAVTAFIAAVSGCACLTPADQPTVAPAPVQGAAASCKGHSTCKGHTSCAGKSK
jgi:hypothetical protein